MNFETAKDIVSIASSFMAPFIGAGSALYILHRNQSEKLHGAVTWKVVNAPHAYEVAFLDVQNRSTQTIAISAVRYKFGWRHRRSAHLTALDYEDPADLCFPYEIAAGAIRSFALDEHQAGKVLAKLRLPSKLFSWLWHRPRLIVEAETMAGARVRVSADWVLPLEKQPGWLRRSIEFK